MSLPRSEPQDLPISGAAALPTPTRGAISPEGGLLRYFDVALPCGHRGGTITYDGWVGTHAEQFAAFLARPCAACEWEAGR